MMYPVEVMSGTMTALWPAGIFKSLFRKTIKPDGPFSLPVLQSDKMSKPSPDQ